MKQIVYNIRYCTGCAACSQVCPAGAVKMEADDEGFLFPRIDENLCNDCGVCRRTCPVNAAFENTRGIVTDEDGSSVFIAGKVGEQASGCGKSGEQVPGCDRFDTAAADSGQAIRCLP